MIIFTANSSEFPCLGMCRLTALQAADEEPGWGMTVPAIRAGSFLRQFTKFTTRNFAARKPALEPYPTKPQIWIGNMESASFQIRQKK